ncbi:MAG: GtrA family protein [Lachnospiraceae bacterium]|nr:GtrA family protein [Lachnospiraceae bacterium]
MKIIEKLTRWALAILPIRLSEKAVDSFVQFVKFCVIGVSNTIVSYVLNILTLKILAPYELSWDYYVGNFVAFMLSVLWSFYWNNRLVFTLEKGQKRHLGKALLKTYLAYSVSGIFICNALSYVWIDKLGISKMLAPMLNLVISVPINFVINKFWAFRPSNEGKGEEDEN